MIDVSLGGAYLAGVISFVSPCVLPIVPPYLCFLAGVSLDELQEGDETGQVQKNVLASAIAFVLGFSTVFVILGATASAIGQIISQYLDILSVIAGIVIIIMGLHFLGVFRLALLYREARFQVDRKPVGVMGAYVIGLAFAFGWTPCIGPVLAAILAFAGTEETVLRGASLLLAYSLGIGLPFILAAVFIRPFLKWAKGFRRHMGAVEKTMGGLLVVTGVLFMTGQMANMAFWLLETFPALQQIG